MVDIILHFGASFIITCSVLFLLLVNAPRIRHAAPRFWQSERQFRHMLFTLVFAVSISIAFLFGVGKEWLDGLGFGSVQLIDMIADLAGVWVGTYLMLRQIRTENKVRRTVTFRSRSNAPQTRPDFFVPPPKWDDPDQP